MLGSMDNLCNRGVISSNIPFQPLCQFIYIAAIAHQFQINVLAPDTEQHPVVPDSLAIKPMKRRLEPDHLPLKGSFLIS